MNDLRQGGCSGRGASGLMILLVLACSGVDAYPQATAPAKRDAIENQVVRQRAATAPAGAVNAAGARPATWMELPRVAGALGVVLAAIFGLRWMGKRYFPAVAGGRAAGVVRVLSRSPVSPRQQILLMQVGKRVLVVADNGTQMSPLADISEPDEVASLLGQLAPRPEAPQEPFDDKLTVAKDAFESQSDRVAGSPDDDEPQQQVTDSASSEIEGLMEKVRALARQLGRS